MDKLAIEIKKLSFRYKISNSWILKNIDFQLKYGELVILTGVSGQGKSTLLSCINGMIPNIIDGELNGEIYVDGKDVSNLRVSEISHLLGSVLQDPESQIINSKIEDEIAFGCENINMPPKKIKESIDNATKMMDLDKDMFIRTLSGGQKQRLMSAAILAMEQKILLFDEPLANLDIKSAHILLSALRQLADKGYAIIIAEHRLELVYKYADKIALLENHNLSFYKDKDKALHKYDDIMPSSIESLSEKKSCFIVNNLSFSINDNTILENVSLDIKKGDRLVIIGENGAGKTTLLKQLARINTPTTGSITQFITSDKISKDPSLWFSKVGYVYQNPNYQLFMPTVYEEICFMAKSKALAEKTLADFSLADLWERHPQSLSEGQKRKLTIACILAMQPEVIFLDEPTVGQDYSSLLEIIEILNKYHERSEATIVSITHDFRCASLLANKVIWLENGKIKRYGDSRLIAEYFISQREL